MRTIQIQSVKPARQMLASLTASNVKRLRASEVPSAIKTRAGMVGSMSDFGMAIWRYLVGLIAALAMVTASSQVQAQAQAASAPASTSAVIAIINSLLLAEDEPNDAAFVSQSVPAVMEPGQTYSVSITMKNTGTQTWTAAENYKLGSHNPADNTHFGIHRVELATSVEPGAQYTFTFNVTAPTTLGKYNFQWRMLKESVAGFGRASMNVPVAVAIPPTLSVQRTPSPMVAGQSYTVTWSSTNATSVSYNCTSSGTGFVDSDTVDVNDSISAIAKAAWVGFDSTCVWTATGEGGSKTLTETMTTVAATGGGGDVGAVTYFHNDVAGTPLLATDASGNVLWKENYRPYGDKLNKQPASEHNKLWFTGKPHDEHTGLTYMGARYYDPMLGRFLGVDPVDFQENNIHSFNRFAYANNNPYKFVDPDGRMAQLLLLLGGIGLTVNEVATSDVPIPGGRIVGGAVTAAEKVGAQALSAGSRTVENIGNRVKEVHGALDPIAAGRRTTAALDTVEGTRILGAGGRDLSPAQRALMAPGEVAAKLPGAHAEVTILQHAAQNGLNPTQMAVSRTICTACRAAIENSGGQLTSPTTAVWPR